MGWKISFIALSVLAATHLRDADAATSEGCFVVDGSLTVVKDFGAAMNGGGVCFPYCRYEKNYRMAGFAGTKCYCMDSPKDLAIAPASACDYTCVASRTTKCGTAQRTVVYDLNPLAKSTAPSLGITNDGETYTLDCQFNKAQPGAQFKVTFLNEKMETIEETIVTYEMNRPRDQHAFTVGLSDDKIRTQLGHRVVCKLESKWAREPHFTTQFSTTRYSSPMRLGVEVTDKAGKSILSPQTALAVFEGTAAETIKVKMGIPPVEKVVISLTVKGGQVVCPHTGQTMDQIVMDKCRLEFTKETYTTEQEVQVQAVEDFKNDGKQTAEIAFDVVDAGANAADEGNPFGNGDNVGTGFVDTDDFPEPEVVTPSPGSGQCNSQNDPHMTTFDRRRFECQIEGEFVLYKHNAEPFEVHTFYKRCNRHAVCNCAVAARVGDDVIVVDKCGANDPKMNRPITVRKYSTDDKFAEHFSVKQNGFNYIINMPNGARVKIIGSRAQFLNVYMNPGRSDRGQARGLCGNYDGNNNNDFIKKDGSVQANVRSPNQFSISWRVPAGETLFNGRVPTGSTTYGVTAERTTDQLICACSAGEEEGTCEASGAMRCEKPAEPIVDPPVRPGGGGGGEFGPVDPNFKPEEPSFPTDGEPPITEEEARQFCNDFIKNTDGFDRCVQEGADGDAALETCMTDIKLSGEKVWAPASVEGFKQDCEHIIDKKPNPGPNPNIFCPNDCSGHGTCTDESECVCEAEWTCEDCSCNKNKAPEVNVSPICCDTDAGNCAGGKFDVSGLFSNSIQYKCLLKASADVTHDVAADFKNIDHLQCNFGADVADLLDDSGLLSIAVVKDGAIIDEGVAVKVSLYDSECMTCDEESGDTTIRDGSCFIDGLCFGDGAKKHDQATWTCDSNKNNRDWTKPDPCDLKGCEDRCEKNGEGEAVCFCDTEGMKLADDGTSCEAITYPNPNPTVTVEEPAEGEWFFKCDYTTEENAVFKHTWYLDGKLLEGGNFEGSQVTAAQLRETLEPEASLIGSKLECRVSGNYNDNPDPNDFGPEKPSEPFPIGLLITYPGPDGPQQPPIPLIEGEDPTDVSVKPTIPVNYLKVCFKVEYDTPEDALVCQYNQEQMDQVVLGKCCLVFTADNWDEAQKIPMQAVEDFKDDGNVKYKLTYTWTTETEEPEIPEKRQANPFDPFAPGGGGEEEVDTGDFPDTEGVTTKPAVSQCDPHMRTFDGVSYDNQYKGEFVLYRHKEKPYEVRTFYKQCTGPWWAATCNCAVAVRAGDDVVVIDKCGGTNPYNSPVTVKKYTGNDNVFTSRMKVEKRGGGREWEVTMPNGARVNVMIASPPSVAMFLNVRMNPGAGDKGKVFGLVGNYNGVANDDLMKPDGTVVARSHRPNAFSLSWRVAQDDTMYGGQVPADATTLGATQLMCTCKTEEGTCNKEGNERCNPPVDPTPEIPTAPPNPDINFPTVDPPEEPQEPTWPTEGGKTEEEAENHCKRIFGDSPSSEKCPNDPAEHIARCVADIQLSDSFDFGASALDSFKADCKDELEKQPNPVLPPGVFCPNDCSGKGQCVENVCQCEAGRSCEDCSCADNEPPQMAITEPCCNTRDEGSTCHSVTVSSTGFPEGDYRCILQAKDKTTGEVTGTVVDETPMMVNFDRIVCNFDEAAFRDLNPVDETSVVVESDKMQPETRTPIPYSWVTWRCLSCENGETTINDGFCYMHKTYACIREGILKDKEAGQQGMVCDPSTDPEGWTPIDVCKEKCTGDCIVMEGFIECLANPCDTKGCAGTCDVVDGEAQCKCGEGEVLAGDGISCEPETPENPCDTKGCAGTCDVVDGEAQCKCAEGEVLAGDGVSCEPVTPVVHPCDINNGRCDQICTKQGAAAVCSCQPGYQMNRESGFCQDVDECDLNTDKCTDICTNTVGSYTCSCNEGRELDVDQHTCKDLEGQDPCAQCDQGCERRGEGHVCTCKPGFTLAQDDRTCIDVNECADNNGGCVMDCYNHDGYHTCQCTIECRPGYVQVQDKCVDACSVENGGCSHTCGHTDDGQVECSCPNEGRLNPLNLKECFGPCVNGKGGGCSEICEQTDDFRITCKCNDGSPAGDDGGCAGDRCATGQIRVNNQCTPKCDHNNGDCGEKDCSVDQGGNVICSCPEGQVQIDDGSCVDKCDDGFQMNMDTGECSDINECDDDTHDCEEKCENTEGGFECGCENGELDLDGKSCTVTNPCDVNKGGCEHSCVHTDHNSYECECNKGFVLNADRHHCDSVCKKDNGGCRENSKCELTAEGDVECPCEEGFEDVGGACTHPCDLPADDNPCGDDMICEKNDDPAEIYTCNCKPGDVMVDGNCEDGCKHHGCDQHCENPGTGDFICACDEGFELDQDGKTCNVINPCNTDKGGCSDVCVFEFPEHHCECLDGKELDVDGRTCKEIDVCEVEKPCDHICQKTDTGYECSCRNGFELAEDKKTCIDKCNIENGGCGHTCTHADDGAVVCECRPGFRLDADRKTCKDIDECKEGTDDCDMDCTNTEGSFECSCPEGFELHTDKKKCDLTDPCKVNNGDCEHECIHEDGEAVCICPDEAVLNADMQTCTHKCDIANNECGQVCDRQTADCTCNQGWELQQDGKTCKDINECDRGEDNCEQICDNVEGTFKCSCEEGFVIDEVDDTKCKDIDECAVNNGGCRQRCNNLPGTYRCECDDEAYLCSEGFTRDPETDKCHDINECDLLNSCPQDVGCENTPGSFECIYDTPKAIVPCDMACPRILMPVCGSDWKTYNNQCLMEAMSCGAVKDGYPPITIVSKGPCAP